MLKKFRGLFVLAWIFFFASVVSAAQPFDATPYEMQGNFVLHQLAFGELRKGEGEYEIRLIGEQPDGTAYNKRFFLEVVPPKGKGSVMLIPLQNNIDGFEPHIELRNFTGYEKNEIFLSVRGADRTFKNKFYILDLDDEENRFIYDSNAIAMPIVKGNFRPGYRLRVLVLDTQRESLIDLSPRKAHYNQRGVYNAKNGALRKELTTWGGEFVSLEPVDVDGDKIFEMRGLMVMYGTGPGDMVSQIQSVLKYRDGGWFVLQSNTAPARGLSFARPVQPQPVQKRTGTRIVRVRRATPTVRRPAAGTINTTPGTPAPSPGAAPAPQ